MVPPARITARASETISWKWVEGSRRRNWRVIAESVDLLVDWEAESLLKKRRPSLEGCVRAERRDEIWWRTGVVDSDLVDGRFGDFVDVMKEFSAWMA
jgi:hypothetical protein